MGKSEIVESSRKQYRRQVRASIQVLMEQKHGERGTGGKLIRQTPTGFLFS